MAHCERVKLGKSILKIASVVTLFLMAIIMNIGINLFASRRTFDNIKEEISVFEQSVFDDRFSLEVSVDDQFLINTTGCRIPNFNPFHPTVKTFLKIQPKVTCKFSFMEDVTTSKINLLYFHPEKLPLSTYQKNSTLPNFKYLRNSQNDMKDNAQFQSSDVMRDYVASNIKCCYKYVTRVTHWNGKLLHLFDGSFLLSTDCIAITQFVTKMKHDCIVVYCSSLGEIIYKNVHHLVIKRSPSLILKSKDVDKKRRFPSNARSFNDDPDAKHTKNFLEKQEDRLSVIIFGTDSISRLNFLRKMPKTHQYLVKNLDALEFVGYNKIGDNTFPNLLPVLTGLSIEEFFRHPCMPRKAPNTFDDCPFIWKEFHSNGYTTAFMEDSSTTGTFNQNNSGFLIPPTDYYGRPYYIASEQLIANTYLRSSSVCQGNTYNIKVLQKISVELLQAYSNDPTFSFFWSSSMTHDFMNSASLVDEPHAEYLESLYETGSLNKSVLIFMSDHGMRYGKFRKTDLGALEERLPMLYMVFPKWFKTRYPAAYSNLKKNTKLLTANFDIYKTLLDIIYTKYDDRQYVRSPAEKNTKGISLFKEIPDDRSCEDAGIHPHFCTCHELEAIDKEDYTVLSGAKYAMDFVNNELKNYKDCITYTNVRVLRSEISKWSRNSNSYIFLQLHLDPGSAIIETTVRNDLQFRRKPSEILGEISRIDSYGNQSHCIDHLIHSKYCICTDVWKN